MRTTAPPDTEFLAHTCSGCHAEPLADHLQAVASVAERFAAAFDSAAWGRLAGLWHDVGKYHPDFQRRIRGEHIAVEHAGAGAALAARKGPAGLPLAFAIAGHHAGLANRESQGEGRRRPLVQRLAGAARDLPQFEPAIPTLFLGEPLPALPAFLAPSEADAAGRVQSRRRFELWTRFLFSALVDADSLVTEAFYDPAAPTTRSGYAAMAQLKARLDGRLAQMTPQRPIDDVRARILSHCRAAADLPPGLFSLTVPTGGGKTLSGMVIALDHALRHGLRRVIVVIPYTSIIEQNAAAYRAAFGDDLAPNVLEHHSAAETPDRERETTVQIRSRLAAENWDAPVVVTTAVQFFESLFANTRSRCRKLHNVARSVIILDEVQTLPPELLDPILDALGDLASCFGCSIVLSTATPPALAKRERQPYGLEDVREIVPNPSSLAGELRRVRFCWPSGPEPTPYEELARSLAQHRQVLAVVHRRADARRLAQSLPEEGRFHLSALMCPAHRSEVLAAARSALNSRAACRLVATQLIEAGVDIDFPTVYRAMAGLDSIVQAAGRCNRGGTLTDAAGKSIPGETHVFIAETEPPAGPLRLGMQITQKMLALRGQGFDPLDPLCFDEYFESLYWLVNRDAKGIQTDRANWDFETVARKFRLIDEEGQCPIVVPWGEALERVERYRHHQSRETMRALQPFTVQIHERARTILLQQGAVERIHDTVDVFTSTVTKSRYDKDFGLIVDDDPLLNHEALQV